MSDTATIRAPSPSAGNSYVLDIVTLLLEISFELRSAESGLRRFLDLLPRTVDISDDVDLIVTFANNKPLLESLCVVPMLIERVEALCTYQLGETNRVFVSTMKALVAHVRKQTGTLDQLTRSLNLYALIPDKPYHVLEDMRRILRAAALQTMPGHELRVEADRYPHWGDITFSLAAVANAVFDIHDRYMTFLDSPLLRHNQVRLITDGLPILHRVGPDGMPEGVSAQFPAITTLAINEPATNRPITNGLATNGSTTNMPTINGQTTSGLTTNGRATNGATTNRRATNGRTTNGRPQ